MSQPLVSVLIPAFNAGKWIREALSSVLAQTWRPIEVIVVDDGSTDDTGAIASQFSGLPLKVVPQSRRGQSAAQNVAMAHAQGEFIQRLDADDLLGPEKIARQMARLQAHPSRIAAGECGRFFRNPSEAVFRRRPNSQDLDPVEWLVRDACGGESMLQAGLWLAHRRLVDAAGPWDESLTLNNDYDYFVRLVLQSEGVLFCEGARVYYRSGNPLSLASQRSAAAWDSAFRTLQQGTGRLLARDAGQRTRQACADLFQQLAYQSYLEDESVAMKAEERAAELGGSSLEMGGGTLFGLMRQTLGWKRAKRVKRVAYSLGYAHVARVKQRLLPRRTVGRS